jgi:apolipoprotein N-acyltransferase
MITYLRAFLPGIFLGTAWIYPEAKFGAILAVLACLGVIYQIIVCDNSDQKLFRWKYSDLFLTGIVSHIIAFNWLINTISKFGGFGIVPASLVFALFCTVSSLQFVAAGYLNKFLKNDLDKFGISATVSWVSLEFIFFRLFPWQFSHSLVAFPIFVQIADIFGVIGVTFLMFWVCESFISHFIYNKKNVSQLASLIFLIFALSYGKVRLQEFSEDSISIKNAPTQKVAIIQANVSIEDKHSQSLILANVERYKKLSKSIIGPDTLIIWPESVIHEFIRNDVASVGNDNRLPFFESSNPLLIGALTYDAEESIYNSALAILNSGTVLEPYHKRILMPFGEFMPLSDVFPWLLKLNPMVANFKAGKSAKVFEYPMVTNEGDFYTTRLSPLICYEDVVDAPSRESTLKGANFLVNLTNDGWFGNTVAPYQHNQIAAFRAIENKRYLIRSTNTGLTSIINPVGITIKELSPFTEGILKDKVPLLEKLTLYTAFVGNFLGWTILLLAATIYISRYSSKDSAKNKTQKR